MTKIKIYKAKLIQDDMAVAWCEGENIDDVERGIQHYYFIYSQDRLPLRIKRNYKAVELCRAKDKGIYKDWDVCLLDKCDDCEKVHCICYDY